MRCAATTQRCDTQRFWPAPHSETSWIIAAKQGNNDSVKHVMDAFKRADVEKEVLATTLREHQAAVDANATKSSAREAAAAAGI